VAARELLVNPRTIRRWILSGDLSTLRICHTLRIDANAIEELHVKQRRKEGFK
jgi:hypothetical protein